MTVLDIFTGQRMLSNALHDAIQIESERVEPWTVFWTVRGFLECLCTVFSRIWINCASCESNSMKRYCYPLVHQMLDFVKGLQHYFSGEVVAPLWHDMMLKIRKANTFDEVLHEHDEFIDSCSNDCFLGHRETLTLVYKVLNCCAKNCRILMVRVPLISVSLVAASTITNTEATTSGASIRQTVKLSENWQ